jgi:hypothetical protein
LDNTLLFAFFRISPPVILARLAGDGMASNPYRHFS